MLGSTLFGSGTATNLQARYAATDLAVASTRARALATVVWATTVGVVLGPNLTGPGGDLARTVGLPPLAGPVLFSVAAFAAAGLILMVGLRPDPLLEAQATARDRPGRPYPSRLAARRHARREQVPSPRRWGLRRSHSATP